jgi:hypothetical protein
MARFTSAYSSLVERMVEVSALRVLVAQTARRPPTRPVIAQSQALYRGAVVLLSSHIEGYVEELCCLILDQIHGRSATKATFGDAFLYYFSKDIIDEIKETREPTVIAGKVKNLWSRDADIWDSAMTFSLPLPSDRFVYGFSTPKVKEIRKMMGRFGYTQFIDDLARLLARDFDASCNMVDNVVNERNKIAHGDNSVTGTASDIEQMVRYVQLFCRGTDQVVATWFRSKGCAIR